MGSWLVPRKPARTYDEERIHDGVYDRATADAMIFRVTKGEFLEWICRDPMMPSYPDACDWLERDLDGFRARYDAALPRGWDAIAASTLEDAASPEMGEKRTVTVKPTGNELKIEHFDMLEHRKLKIATKFKYLTMYDNRQRAAEERLARLRGEGDDGGREERIEVRGGLPDDEP